MAEYEQWLFDHEIEISDGSHDNVSRLANMAVVREFMAVAQSKITIINIFELPHAQFVIDQMQGVASMADLKAGYCVWQIYHRHRGQEIVLLDDDWVFPLVARPDTELHSAVKSENWRADQYRFGSGSTGRKLLTLVYRDGLKYAIHVAKQSHANTLQLCTRGVGVCNDYSWIECCPELIDGNNHTTNEIAYLLDRPRLMRGGFLTPAWIGVVPEVMVLPPDTPNDDTISLMVTEFGPCLWHPFIIEHRPDVAKSLSHVQVEDAEIVSMVMMLFGRHDGVSLNTIIRIAGLIAESKRTRIDEVRATLSPWINNVLLNKERAQLQYIEPEEECE